MIMLRAAILILTLAGSLLVRGGEAIDPTGNKTEISSESPRRILFGTKVRGNPFPYLVKLRVGKGVCGGTIIANHWILTAGHCLLGKTCADIKIYPATWKNTEILQPAQCFIHEQHRASNYEYDVGLLKLGPNILQDGRSRLIKLPPPGKVYPPGTAVLIAGWGVTEKKVWPGRLLVAEVHIDPWEKCNTKYLAHERPGRRDIPKRTLCLQGRRDRPSNICHGDSGGPAVTDDGFQIGIASFGLVFMGDCMLGAPGMFVNVADYLPWIYRHIDPSKDTRNFPVTPEHILT